MRNAKFVCVGAVDILRIYLRVCKLHRLASYLDSETHTSSPILGLT